MSYALFESVKPNIWQNIFPFKLFEFLTKQKWRSINFRVFISITIQQRRTCESNLCENNQQIYNNSICDYANLMICYTRCEKTVDSVTDTVLLHQLNSNYIKELVYETCCKICTFNCIDRDIVNLFRLLWVNHSNGHIIAHHISRTWAVLHMQRKKV